MDKKKLRQQLRLSRQKMSAEEVAAKSSLIIERLIKAVDWRSVKSLHVYQPITSLAEIDTAPLLDFLADASCNMRAVIQGCSQRSSTSKEKFDLVIVPTLGFDKRLHRLGWGGGWYDRFLATQPQAVKIGLSYQSGLVEEGLPAEAHDITLDKIITEQGIITKS